MKNPIITLRPATVHDASNIAWAVLEAVGIEEITSTMINKVSSLLCEREDTLYSWKNTFVAEVNGEYAGSLTSYAGDNYKKLRSISFPIMRDHLGCDFMEMENETGPGEYYLDSLAILPQFRGQGIASMLLQNGIRIAQKMKIQKVTLVVDPEHKKVQKLYEREGFKPLKMMNLFGQPYRKMYYEL